MKAILIMLAALPLLAADATTHFAGRVFGGPGASEIAGAIVTVSTPGGFVSSVTTGKNGSFSFNSLPEGAYDFRVTARGYAIYERQITVSADFAVRELDIRMLVPADKQTVSVVELRNSDAQPALVVDNSSARRGY